MLITCCYLVNKGIYYLGGSKMIKVCEHCSNVDVNELVLEVGSETVEVGCIGKCGAYSDKAYGFINDELVVEENSTDWINKAK